MLGREGEREASRWSSVEPSSCFSRYVGGMIIEDQLDRGAGRISSVETLEEFDELSAAVAVSDERMNLPGKQVDSGQQAKRALTFVLVIPREGRVDAGLGRQIGCRPCDGPGSRLFVVGDDRHSLDGFARLGGSLFQDLDLAVDTENLRHLLLKFGVATFQIVAHLVRLDFLLAEDLAHRALDQLGETFVPGGRSVLARVACQQPRGPHLVRIAVLRGLVARQRHQPGCGRRRDDRFFARPWSVLDCRQRPISQCPLHAALNSLMMNPNSLPHRTERRLLAIRQQHLRPRFADFEDANVLFAPKIGIGGSLSAPPLPHHRAYGSVHGGSIELSLLKAGFSVADFAMNGSVSSSPRAGASPRSFGSKASPCWLFCRFLFTRYQSYLPLSIVRAFSHRFRLRLSVSPPFGLGVPQ